MRMSNDYTKHGEELEADEPTPLLQRTRYVAWLLLAGMWVITVAAFVSYDPADAPGHTIAPANDPAANWVGAAGAILAHELYLMFGPGVWIAVVGAGVYMAARAIGRTVTQTVLRAAGVVVMMVATSSLIALWRPVGDAWNTLLPGDVGPQGAGGLIAIYLNTQFAPVLGAFGMFVVLGIVLWVGAVITADQWAMALPHGVGRLGVLLAQFVRPAVAVAGPAQADNATQIPASGHSQIPVRGRNSDRPRRRQPIEDDETADQDHEAPRGFGKRILSKLKRRRADEQPDTDVQDITHPDDTAAGEHTPESLDQDAPDDGDHDTPDTDIAPDDDTDHSHADSSRPRFTPEQLRAKIKELPIHFAQLTAGKVNTNAALTRDPDFSGYRFPELHLLEDPESNFSDAQMRIVREQAVSLESALQQYNIDGEVVGIDSGPVITLFEVRLALGTKVARINAVASDLARALKSQNIRIVPNMVGKDTVGIEVPNIKKERVRLKELMTANPEAARKMRLPMFLGKDASGQSLVADLATMPHMLIAGTTGSGKSVCMNAIIMSFLFARRPDELKLVLVDPKMVEMAMFKDIPHLMCPVVTEMTRAASILEWATTKMDERYALLAEAGVRDIASYNALEWDQLKDRFDPQSEAEEAAIPRKLPYLVFIIDELADLMMTAKEVEGDIVRLAQKSRAVGMHLILATQRPQANVVTGLIKSNMPCRVSFKVASGMDSRIVLDQKGAELLLGQGDMLYLSPRTSKTQRSQGTLVEDSEIRTVTRFIKNVSTPSYEPQLMQIKQPTGLEDGEEHDPLFEDAVRVVLETQRGSVSLLQRRLTVGYSRASRMIEQMEAMGLLGSHKNAQAREVTMTHDEYEALKEQAEADARAVEVNGMDEAQAKGVDGPDRTNSVTTNVDADDDPEPDDYADEPETDQIADESDEYDPAYDDEKEVKDADGDDDVEEDEQDQEDDEEKKNDSPWDADGDEQADEQVDSDDEDEVGRRRI
jgi:S-DNA-T family DNA segregation ATPase FtsK/SpoIIIE